MDQDKDQYFAIKDKYHEEIYVLLFKNFLRTTQLTRLECVYTGESKETISSTFVDISAVRANFWVKFYTTVKQ